MVDTPTDTPYHSKALPKGSILREWKLENVLGVGGFGIVYRGRGVYFDEVVAIKEYFPSAISDRQDGTTVTPTDSSAEEVYALGLSKFVEEAKILWNLSKPDRHPNIVAVKSLFEIHGTAYMVMDFESGVSLSQMLRDGKRFDEASLLALIRPIAQGLERVHRAGVIHRDIKPANILVDDTGRPVLIDFGSARFESGQATSTRVTFYTPPYAAIEQYVKTYPQGPWTDIYALGVALYQCVAGEKPPDALERMHGGAGESLSSRERPGFSREFLRAVDSAMALRPSERPQSMFEWMRMFEPGYFTDEQEATRISVSAPMLEAHPEPPVAATSAPATTPVAPKSAPASRKRAPAAPKPEPVAAAASPDSDADPTPRPARRWPLFAAAAGAVVVVAGLGGAAYLYLLPHHGLGLVTHPGTTTTTTSPTTTPAGSPATAVPAGGPAAAAVVPSVQPIDQDAGALIADAQHYGRPRPEMGALGAAKAKIDALAAQIATTPAAAAPPLVTQLDALAVGMARGEAATLGRISQAQAREVASTLGDSSEGAGAAAAVRQAKNNLAATIAGASQPDPIASIEAARHSLAAFAAFSSAYAAATPYYAAIRRTSLTAMVSADRSVSAQVVALAQGSKPWVFASQGRKQSYQLLQDNAARAKTLEAQADQLAQGAAGQTDVSRLEAAVGQAASIKSSLNALYASSSASAAANK